MLIHFLWPVLFFHSAFSYYSIEDANPKAISNDTTNAVAHQNVLAMLDAFNSANTDPSPANRVVLLPAGKTFYFFNVTVTGVSNMTLRIEGTFAISNNITEWERILQMPKHINDEDHPSGLLIEYSTNIEVTGNVIGILDGQGHDWWDYFYKGTDNRPFLFRMKHSKNVEIHQIHLRNSPFWNIDFVDMDTVHIHDMDVYVDWPAQHAYAKKYGAWDAATDQPYPANTDGMDLRGKNFLVENVKIESGDDAVAIKPTNSYGNEQNCSVTGVCKNAVVGNIYSNCSQDMIIRNVITIHTVGLAVGSIPPDVGMNCIKNILFENIQHTLTPYRGFYIKTNPGNEGTGVVDNITVRNMFANGTQDTFLYIGPQQQQIPGTNGTGCSSKWPYESNECATQPLVNITNVYIENALAYNSHHMPGLIWCDPTNKCKNISLVNVQNTGNFSFMPTFYCQNVEVTQYNTNGVADSCLGMISTDTKSSATIIGNQMVVSITLLCLLLWMVDL